MKLTLRILAGLCGCVLLYALYCLIMFSADKPREFVFKDPVLPPELLAEQEAMRKSALTSEQQLKKDAALGLLQKAIDESHLIEEDANKDRSPTSPASATLSILNGYYIDGKLPVYFLGMSDGNTGKRQFGPLNFNDPKPVIASLTRKNISCNRNSVGNGMLIGNDVDNIIECDYLNKGAGAGDRLILGGPGDDKITDTFGNRIVNGGTGNDTIALGPGRSIIVLEDAWGNDHLTVDCMDSKVSPNQIPDDFPFPWTYKTMNFIILSPRLDPKQIVWDGSTLVNKDGGDRLTINENCFTVVPPIGADAQKPAENPTP